MIVIPAIDIRRGKVVRLTHGDPSDETVYADDPLEVARRFESDGAQMIHVVDLDAALESGENRRVVREICGAVQVPVQTGGGLRSLESVEEVLSAGAARAVVSTQAALDSEFLTEAATRFGDQLVAAVDIRDGRVMIRGWREVAGLVDEVIPGMETAGAARFLVTSIAVDGTLEGPDLELYKRVLSRTGRPVLASGGVRTSDDLRALADLGVEGAIVGKAIYEGTISVAEVNAP
ncbi:MAG: 1-(5-phosphoribosyl)-5-[(5-phosphoribosylamino)methylideneamino]imidazole-4-carboxamide isomerase [Actinomycetota bacterium]